MGLDATVRARTITLTAATPGQLSTGSEFSNQILVKAPSANPATIYLGGSDVSATNGYPIAAGAAVGVGDVSYRMNAQFLNMGKIYVYSAVSGCTAVVLYQVKG